MIRAVAVVLALAPFFGAGATLAQDKSETLAQMRAELQVLAGDLQALRAELVGGGQAAINAAGGPGALDRMNAMEAEIARLTAATEQLDIRIGKVVSDGTNRIGDLEFRICELEEGCDPANLPISAALGGDAGATTLPSGTEGGSTTADPAQPQVELAMNEQSDFDMARAKLDAGDFQGAADGFGQFVTSYPGGPLTGEAQFLQGEALGQAGDTAGSARAYLAAFSGDPTGPRAPSSLLRLGAALGLLGQTQDACVTLGEVPARFPATSEAAEAQQAMQQLGCQ
jgi:tol-pal system protein YbgF